MTVLKLKHPVSRTFNNLVDDFFTPFTSIYQDDFSKGANQIVPVNVKEIENGYQLEVVAPGLEKENFRINLEDNLLTISADRKAQEENKTEKHIRKEYSYQSFKRSFTLDENIDTENIEAKYYNGVLTVNLFKKAEVKAPVKQISVQ